MIGEFVIIGDSCYLRMNEKGTLQKLPRLKWYQILFLFFKSRFKGGLHIQEIKEIALKNKW